MKPVHAPARRPTVILHPFASRGADVIFRVEAADGGVPSGQIEERTKGLFGHNSKMHELRAENRFRIGALNNGYRLSVIPDQDVTVYFLTRHTQFKDFVKWLLIGLGGAIALSIVLNLLGFGGTPPGAAD